MFIVDRHSLSCCQALAKAEAGGKFLKKIYHEGSIEESVGNIGKNSPLSHGNTEKRLLEFTPSAKTRRGEFKQRFIMGAGGDENQFIMIEDELTEQIIWAAIEVHKHWGPGLYEEIYEF